MYQNLEVGKSIQSLVGYPEGCIFESSQAGLVFIYNMSHPTQKETEAFKSGVPGEVKFIRINGIFFILSKLGFMEWAEAPYAIQLSPNPSFQKPQDGCGYTLLFLLTDAPTFTIDVLDQLN